MSDYGCLGEHLPKTLGQTIYKSMMHWFFGGFVVCFFLNCNSGRVSFRAKAEGQQEDLRLGKFYI